VLRPELLREPLDHLADMRLPPLPPAGQIGELERPQLGGEALAHAAVRDLGEFHGRAADVADEPVGPRPAEQHPLRREPRLLAPVDDAQLEPRLARDLGAELRPVGGVAHRGRGGDGERRRLHPLGERGEAAQRAQRPRAALGVEPPGLAHAGAEAAHDLLVVEIGRAARRAVEDHEPHRVGAHVHHAHARQRPRLRVAEKRLPEGPGFAPVLTVHAVHRVVPVAPDHAPGRRRGQSAAWVRCGTSPAPAEPRPESEGFSMKKR